MNMRKRITILIFTFLSSAFCFASSPQWLTDLEKAFPTVDYIRTVGEGNSETFAKKAALSELSSYFNQTIYSQTQALKSIERDNSVEHSCGNCLCAGCITPEHSSPEEGITQKIYRRPQEKGKQPA